ncbi:exonuclease domain-containing protein [Galenea microaerophila]
MNIWQRVGFQWRLRQALAVCPEAVKNWLQALPPLGTPLSKVDFLALDFETTGLNPKKDAILSMGWVPLMGGRIKVGQGAHYIVHTDQTLPEATIKVHGITHQAVQQGEDLAEVLTLLWKALRGEEAYSRIPLVHFARIEKQFLAAACQAEYGCAPPLAMVDTFDLAVRQFPPHTSIEASQFRLANLRRQYHLPDAPPHNALEDAIATAELFQAQMKFRSDFEQLRLQDLLI